MHIFSKWNSPNVKNCFISFQSHGCHHTTHQHHLQTLPGIKIVYILNVRRKILQKKLLRIEISNYRHNINQISSIPFVWIIKSIVPAIRKMFLHIYPNLFEFFHSEKKLTRVQYVRRFLLPRIFRYLESINSATRRKTEWIEILIKW